MYPVRKGWDLEFKKTFANNSRCDSSIYQSALFDLCTENSFAIQRVNNDQDGLTDRFMHVDFIEYLKFINPWHLRKWRFFKAHLAKCNVRGIPWHG